MMRAGDGIDAIATKVGYDSASSFISSFRPMTKTSPHQFAIENQLRVGQ
jgi:AraC-like DNA-binding protein